MNQTDDRRPAAGAPVERPVRTALPEQEAARVYAELREMGYTWHQAHETIQRIAAERERTIEEVLRGLRSEDDSPQLRAIVASIEALRA